MHREKSSEVSLWNLSPIQRRLKSTDSFVIIFYLKTRASYSQSINRYLAKKSLYISPGVHEGNSLCSYRKRIQEIAWMVFSSPMLVFLNSSTASPKGWEVLWLFWGLCDLFQQSKRGESSISSLTLPWHSHPAKQGAGHLWGGRFKDHQHSWLITNFMAREGGRWRLSTLINVCFKSTLHSLPDACFTKAKSCCY